MNVRLFMLIAMTAVFGVLWSSDRQYQETQIALARAAREAAVKPMIASIETQCAPTVSLSANSTPGGSTAGGSTVAISTSENNVAITAAPSIALPSTIAPLIVESSVAEAAAAESATAIPVRQPVFAQRAAAEKSLQTLSCLLSYGRPSFSFEGTHSADVSRDVAADRACDLNLVGLIRWADRLRWEIAGETCWMRWQFRRSAHSAQHQLAVLLRQRLDWYALAEKFARGTFWQMDSVTTNSAARTIDEKR